MYFQVLLPKIFLVGAGKEVLRCILECVLGASHEQARTSHGEITEAKFWSHRSAAEPPRMPEPEHLPSPPPCYMSVNIEAKGTLPTSSLPPSSP